MASRFQGKYPPTWTKAFRDGFRAERGNRCERCKHDHEPASGHAMTIHHLDNDKANCEPWNLAVLCQRCHLTIQGKVNMFQDWMFIHTDWMEPHVRGRDAAIEAGTWPRAEGVP